MLISVKYGFTFLAMPKCGSTAVEAAFRRYSDITFGGMPNLKHISYSTYERRILPLIAEQCRDASICQPYSFFREPLEWIFSWYKFRGRPDLARPDSPLHMNYTGNITFSQFLDEYFRPRPKLFARVGYQSKFIEDLSGRCDAVKLFKYEEFHCLTDELSRRVGTKVKLVQKNVSPPAQMDLQADAIREARDALRKEYQIYERI